MRVVVLLALLTAQAISAPEPDFTWTAGTELADVILLTDRALGEAQGAALIDDKIYLFGDRADAHPRAGIIREYDRALRPTGRQVILSRDGKPLVRHPTGLAHDKQLGVYLGDTVNGRGRIYRLDWAAAWRDGNLDHAVLSAIDDDLARNGCRPEFVTVDGRRWLATTDYNAADAALRLYDAEKLSHAGRSSAPGVLHTSFPTAPLTQSLVWDETTGRLWHARNVKLGRGWQLDSYDLAAALSGANAHPQSETLPPHDELEGFLPLADGRVLYVSSSEVNNLVLGRRHSIAPRPSPPGFNAVNFANRPPR